MTDFSSQPQRPHATRRERAGAAGAGGRYRAADGARVAQPQRPHARSHAAPAREQAGARPRVRETERTRPRTSDVAVTRRARERSAAKASPAQAILGWCQAHLMICIVVGAVVLVLGVLYSPAKALYGARRTNAVLAQRLDAATSSAQTLQSEVDSLMTREGIEDEARRRGYVEEGDTAVDMDGVTDSGSATTDESVTNDSSVAADEEQTPWYTSVLDFIFGYDPSTQGVG